MIVATAFLSLPARGAPPDNTGGLRGLGQRLKRGWSATGIVVHGGVDIGAPGLGGVHVGAGYKHATASDPAGSGAFVVGTGNLTVLGCGGVASPNRRLRGRYASVAGYDLKNPIYGDRICTAVVPGFVYLGASRTGGLGVKVAPPRWTSAACLVRPNVDLYVTHRRLAPVSNKILDCVEKVKTGIGRCLAPVKRRIDACRARRAGRAARRSRRGKSR
jgi:hypothetical protein